MSDLAKNGAARGSGDVAFCGVEDGLMGSIRPVDEGDPAFSDPAFYIKCPDREAAGRRGRSEA